MTRRRYETQVLVGELKRERRNATWLIVLGLGILGFLAYYFTRMGGDAVPTVPLDATAQAPAPAPAPVAAPAPAVASPSPSPAPATEATLVLELPRAGQLWINGKALGEVKNHTQKLPAGKHSFRAKLGRKEFRHTFDAEVGVTYKASVDPKKRKWDVTTEKR